MIMKGDDFMVKFKDAEDLINGIKKNLGDKAVDVSEDLVKLHGVVSDVFTDLAEQKKTNEKVNADLIKAQKTNSELASNLMTKQAFHEEQPPEEHEKPSLNKMLEHAEENI